MLAMLTKAGWRVTADPVVARRLLAALARGKTGGTITGGPSRRARSFTLDPVNRNSLKAR